MESGILQAYGKLYIGDGVLSGNPKRGIAEWVTEDLDVHNPWM
jgi:hypothetical protein